MTRRRLAELLLGGWRLRRGRVTLRIMPLRWYIGPGIAPGYAALNFGPLQLFIAVDVAAWLLREVKKDERGQALLETALLFTFLLILVAGVAEVGVVLHRQLVVVNAAREGARFGAFGAGVEDVYDQVVFATSGVLDFTEDTEVVIVHVSLDDAGNVEEWEVWPEGVDASHVTQAGVLESLAGGPYGVQLVVVDVRYWHKSPFGFPVIGAAMERVPIGSWTAMRVHD